MVGGPRVAGAGNRARAARRRPGAAPAGASPSPRRVAPAGRLFAHDRRLGADLVAGADEAGRGCLAGPLVAAAVTLDLARLSRRARRALGGIDDSKRLDPAARTAAAAAIWEHARQVVVVSACAASIDRHGLHVSNLRLLATALAALDPPPDVALVDGFDLGPRAPAHRRVIGGDRTSACVAAASIIAKTTRDRLMRGPAATAFPRHGFARHVGYATPEHHRALGAWGLTDLHRRSFRSVAYRDAACGE